MNLRQYILILSFGSAIALCAWLIVLINIDPVTAGLLAYAMFYATLFAALTGVFTTIATLFRSLRKKRESVELTIKTSFRQGAFLALLIELSLYLIQRGSLSWWVLLLIILILGFVEFSFLSRSHKTA